MSKHGKKPPKEKLLEKKEIIQTFNQPIQLSKSRIKTSSIGINTLKRQILKSFFQNSDSETEKEKTFG